MNPSPNPSILHTAQIPLIPVVLCGGSGTRLWPLSREGYPKQFLRLNDDESLLQKTMRRLVDFGATGTPLLICNESSRFVAAEQLREIGVDKVQIILEPMRRNTAPAIAVAALHALSCAENALLLVLPSDHMIKDKLAFSKTIAAGRQQALDGDLVTFGVRPVAAETGYGYIRSEKRVSKSIRAVTEFVEKPDLETAERYLASGEYYWNSGMYLFQARRYLEELAQHHPDILAACREALAGARKDLDFLRLDGDGYAGSPDISIDYAVMERTTRASMVPMDAGWSDIGSWASVWDAADKDEKNNAVHGDVVLQDCENCLVHGSTRLITAVGIRDTVIVETADALLIIGTDCAQETRNLVNTLLASKRNEVAEHREVFRPWGSYDSIGTGKRFQVKRISVKPGGKLSLQMHYHRAEHWVVVSGTARITNGENEFLLTENQSTYIPLGVVHSLENPGRIPLELIEIQSGIYLGEDDIVRLSDNYGRA